MSREQAISDLEQDLKDRYPRARVTVTADSDRVTVEVAIQPDDSFKVTLDPDRIEHGSAVLARIFQRTNLVVTSPILSERIHGTRKWLPSTPGNPT